MTHYEVLQVMPTASPEVIKMAYKALASKYHPDVYQGDKTYAELMMKRINEAYAVLSTPVSRQEYDRSLQFTKEQASHTYQTTQTQQKPPVKKKIDFSTFIAIAFVFAIIIGIMLLDDADIFAKIKPRSSYQSIVLPTAPPTVIIPRSGDILSGSECFDGSELTITADDSASCVVKLKTPSGAERLSFYVRAGDTVTIGVPAEYLYVYFASGEIWCGKSLLFGDDTYYSMDDEILDFTQYTWEYTLYPVNSGNFSETPIDPEEF